MGPLALAGWGAGAVAAGLAYSAGYEVRAFTLRRYELPALPAGAAPVKILHISDLHLMPRQLKKQHWLAGLAELEPDLILGTGDFIASNAAIAPLLTALQPFADVPGGFVFGSNDYYGPKLKNPARYLLPDSGRRIHDQPLESEVLRTSLTDFGWLDLTHRRARLQLAGQEVELRGVDDPHLDRDDYSQVAGAVPAGVLGIGVTHAPYLRVLDAMAMDGCALIVAGHTHGGQLCLPGFGTIVTNCDLDRRRARGVSRHRNAWLHVSAGLGTNPYTPVRFACRPEASLLTLVAGA